MFKPKKSTKDVELEFLRKIYSEIRNMQKDLKLIINLLQDLKVYIDQRQIEFIANTLSTKINTTNLFLIGWLETGKGNIEEQFASIHETKNLLGIYGFAHIHVYILALQTELELCYWLNRGDYFTKAILEDSRQYFTDALNENHTLETPTKRLKSISNDMSKLKQKFPIGNYTEKVKITTVRSRECYSEGYKIVLYTLTITGDITKGFSFSYNEKILEKVDPIKDHDCKSPGGPRGGGGRSALIEFEENLFEINSNTPKLDKQISNYNNAHELYLQYLKSKLELTATINTIIKMLEIIDTWDK